MKTYTANHKFVIFILISILIVLGVQRMSYGQNLNVDEPPHRPDDLLSAQ